MTDREKIEACEEIIKIGDCVFVNDNRVRLCTDCFLNKDCFYAEDIIGENMVVVAAKKYLAAHPADNEWKPLEVDNLPGDILKIRDDGKPEYVFMYNDKIDYTPESGEDILEIIRRLYSRLWVYYRKRQPEEKSVEEMADIFDEMEPYIESILAVRKSDLPSTYAKAITEAIKMYHHNKAAKC